MIIPSCDPSYQAAASVVARLSTKGYQSFFAGGCVRDQLRGQIPQDYDIATEATPEQILRAFPRGNQIGAHFGVILVKEGSFTFEIATFREDGDYHDCRRPDHVIFSTPQRDAQRRDFTINGMFYDPLREELIDYVGGQEDLKKGQIRAIGCPSARFKEDALRLLRAVRFATTFDYAIETETWNALVDQAALSGRLSIERVQGEWNKILRHPNRSRGLDLATQSGILSTFLPEVLALVGCEQPPQWHPEGDVYNHTKKALSLLPPTASLELCLATLFHDIGKPATAQWDAQAQRIRFNRHDAVGAEMTREILGRMRYSNAVINAVTEMVAHHMRFMHVQDMRPAKLRRFLSRETFSSELELHRVDCLSSNGMTENYDFLLETLASFKARPVLPPPLISGHDLQDLGLPPGPLYRTILEDIQTAQLEEMIHTSEEALYYVKEKYLTS